jgi:hypothetical protein
MEKWIEKANSEIIEGLTNWLDYFEREKLGTHPNWYYFNFF